MSDTESSDDSSRTNDVAGDDASSFNSERSSSGSQNRNRDYSAVGAELLNSIANLFLSSTELVLKKIVEKKNNLSDDDALSHFRNAFIETVRGSRKVVNKLCDSVENIYVDKPCESVNNDSQTEPKNLDKENV